MSPKILDLTGQRFGMLTALSRLPNKEKGYYLWNCLCDCGEFVQVSTKKLTRGTIKDCGCNPKNTVYNGPNAENITGQCFGKLTAVSKEQSKNGKTRWLCNCDCGGVRIATTYMLKSGRTWHCGCMTKRNKHRGNLNLEGRRFGRLIAFRSTDKRNNKGSVIWECKCDCGAMAEVSCEGLIYGNNTSCGCRKKEIKESIGNHLTFVDNTCVEWLRSRKHRCDNTSGFRGVYKLPNGRWKVLIGFKNKRYYMGTFETFDEAKAVRLEAEKALHDDFVFAWEKWNAIATEDPDWALDNPFIFDVSIKKGELVVYAPVLSESIETADK